MNTHHALPYPFVLIHSQHISETRICKKQMIVVELSKKMLEASCVILSPGAYAQPQHETAHATQNCSRTSCTCKS